MNLPNKLTMGRIFAIPVFIVVFLMGYRYVATVIFILAAITDMLDGKIARKYNLVTNFGKLMDPLADKLLVMSALICLAQIGDVPGWMVIIILGREFIITGMRQVAAAQGIVIAAGTTGKIKTITQMIAIPLLLLNNWPFQPAQLQSADGYDFPVDRTGDDSSVWNGIYREKQATVFHVGFTYHFIRKKAKQV